MSEPIIRPATVAGTFYPNDSIELRKMLEAFLNNVPKDSNNIHSDVSAIVVPHAGYVFSGQVAAYSYKQLIGKHYDLAIVLAPSHHKYFVGSSVFNGDYYSTPLGEIKVQNDFANLLVNNQSIKLSLDGHEWQTSSTEHSLEVQLPFLQIVQPNLPIVPIVIGSQDYATVNSLVLSIVNAIKQTNKKVLIIASSDLSHFHNQDEAQQLDWSLIEAFEHYDYFKIELNAFGRNWEACGAAPISVAMQVSELLGANLCLALNYATSAKSPYSGGDTNRVVGYYSGIIGKSDLATDDLLPNFSDVEKFYLKTLAKASVESIINNHPIEIELLETENLELNFPAFVTINKNNELRACMGHIIGSQDINNEIISTAQMAATKDHRFGAIRSDELNELEYEVTVLSRMKRITDFNEIQIGKHGLYIRYNQNSGLLLPQVASDRNWSVSEFLENICLKANLQRDMYNLKEAQIFIFEAIIIE